MFCSVFSCPVSTDDDSRLTSCKTHSFRTVVLSVRDECHTAYVDIDHYWIENVLENLACSSKDWYLQLGCGNGRFEPSSMSPWAPKMMQADGDDLCLYRRRDYSLGCWSMTFLGRLEQTSVSSDKRQWPNFIFSAILILSLRDLCRISSSQG